ncbi:hypothetical protein ROLI_002200 [Roseobacter fucihabitans]|uniref:FAD:protein FMN transferase n=1 Tax=Roseobacter fucihabitans TaxID=1537242 RepID=A0ABZ2BPM4_9RHOB|nr:FAD:protein FMN transferase [Roseobacter litoralis]MBC6963471.1 Thiamine biosynthesis lipoprotein ApbE precursor [Roseobacter litoralis]
MSTRPLSRRRFLRISAAVPLCGLSRNALAAASTTSWRGQALGAQAQIIVAGLDPAEAAPVFAQVRDEIARLETILSLYRPHSELSRLNATGALMSPSADLLEVLSLSKSVWQASGGSFDPTIQPLWIARALGEPAPAPSGDFGDVVFSAKAARLKPGSALTLNGIAQGYITDRVAELLRRLGLQNVIVDAGEQRAWGSRPEGGAWRVGIADPSGTVVRNLTLKDRALATSSSRGTVLTDGRGHIIDARSGLSAQLWNTLSVTHETAALADALSTAACCLNTQETEAMLGHFPSASLAYRG